LGLTVLQNANQAACSRPEHIGHLITVRLPKEVVGRVDGSRDMKDNERLAHGSVTWALLI